MQQHIQKTLFPAMLILAIFVVTLLYHLGVSVDQWGLISSVAAFLLLIVEHVMPRDPTLNYFGNGKEPHYSDAVVDFLFMFGVTPVSFWLRGVAAFGIARYLQHSLGLSTQYSIPVVAQILILIAGTDFLRYWVHRASHRYSWIWRFHALHHIAENLNTLKSTRTHPVDDVLLYTPEMIVYLVLGFDPVIVTGVYSVTWLIPLMNHSNINFDLGVFGKIFMSPRNHAWHHSLQTSTEKTYNFAEIITLWDRVFGTFKDESLQNFKAGVVTQKPRSLMRELLGWLYLPNRDL